MKFNKKSSNGVRLDGLEENISMVKKFIHNKVHSITKSSFKKVLINGTILSKLRKSNKKALKTNSHRWFILYNLLQYFNVCDMFSFNYIHSTHWNVAIHWTVVKTKKRLSHKFKLSNCCRDKYHWIGHYIFFQVNVLK